MCGRFALGATPEAVAELFSLPAVPVIPKPRYNIAPSQDVAVVALRRTGERALGMAKWGLVPGWANSPTEGTRPANARAETVATSPVFRDPFRRKRCLVPVSGFYEWRPGPKPSSPRTPYHFRLRSGGPFALAGLWDVWGAGAEKLVTCCTITVPPNAVVAPVHDRMPLVVPREHFDRWLDPATPVARLLAMLVPYPAAEMEAVRVGRAVGNVRNEGPGLIEPAPEERSLF